VILAAELERQCDRHTRHVAPAEDGMTACQGEQSSDRIGLLVDQRSHLLPPRLIDPLEHRQGEVLLVLELVIKRPRV